MLYLHGFDRGLLRDRRHMRIVVRNQCNFRSTRLLMIWLHRTQHALDRNFPSLGFVIGI